MRGNREEVAREIRDLIRCDAAYDAACEARKEADRAVDDASEALARASTRLRSALEDDESVLCDGHLVTRGECDEIEAIELDKVARLD